MAAAGTRLSEDWSKFEAASHAVFATDNWIWLLVAWVGLKTIHETAHGLACLRYGGAFVKPESSLRFWLHWLMSM
ncbi:MAG: hypothetical protein R3C49_06690 [Planctomycetaceae bacterium]